MVKNHFKDREVYELKNYKNFVNIEGSFGVNQHWLELFLSKKKSSRSCAVAAMANLIEYELRDSINYNNRNKVVDLMLQLYKIIKPQVWGVPFMRYIFKGLKRYSMRNNLNVEMVKFKGKFTLKSVEDFLIKAIENDSPPLLLTWNHPDGAFKYHWITITRIFYKDNKTYINFSSWGDNYTRDLEEYLNSKSLHRELAYFIFHRN